jgi:hypothetical protein
MKKILQFACVGLLTGNILLCSGCVATVSTPGAEVYYDYDYYPGVGVYYYPRGHVYYWNESGAWRSGRNLPPRYDLHTEHSEHFRGHTQQPWSERR